MNKLLATTILATSLVATGVLAQTTPPAPAASPPASTMRLPPTPVASLDGISANDLIGAAVRTHVADASRTLGSTAPRTTTPATPPAATTGSSAMGTGTAGSGVTTGTTGTGSTTGTTATGAMSPPPATGSTGASSSGTATPLPSAPATSTAAAPPPADTRNTDRIGKVNDLILGKNGVDQLIISSGGLMGIGDKLHAVPFDKATFVRDGNDIVVMVSMSEAELKALPEYKKPTR